MNQKERAEKFLEELSELSKKHGFVVSSQGAETLLVDRKEGGWVVFGQGMFNGKYEVYEDE